MVQCFEDPQASSSRGRFISQKRTMELPSHTLAAGLAKAARLAGCFLRDATDVQDVVQAAAARLARALERGLVLKSVEAYLVRVARLESLRLLRRRRNWQNREGDGSMDPADVAIAGEALFDEFVLGDLLARLREELAPAVRGWLEDQLSRLSVREIAERDGVDEAAVRMRRMPLVEAILESDVVKEFVEFPVTFRRLQHLWGGGCDAAPPNPRTPEPLKCIRPAVP